MRGLLKSAKVEGIDIDGKESSIVHSIILKKKKFLNSLYKEFYRIFKRECRGIPKGLKVELGSGGGFIKDIIPDTITSEVIEMPEVDKVFSAEKMPFKDESVSVFFLLNTFHHIPNCRNFFRECQRCLVKGGKVVMIEPSNTIISRFIHKNFHEEPFDENAKTWEFISENKRMSASNQALAYIVFIRDFHIFKKEFPFLKLEYMRSHTPFRYILSGGVSRKQLVPDWSYSFFSSIDHFFSKMGYFYTIVIKKTG